MAENLFTSDKPTMFTVRDLLDASLPIPREMLVWGLWLLIGLIASVCAYFIVKGKGGKPS